MSGRRMSSSLHKIYDLILVGAGIVGLATAYQILRRAPGLRVLVLEKEQQAASHQTGHNSGVLHTGIYYKPGSSKAQLCHSGRLQMLQFCQEEGLAFELCGKVIVATEQSELARLDALHKRALANQVHVTRLDAQGLRAIEPHAAGLSALHVPDAGIIDYREVSSRLVERIVHLGATLHLGSQVLDVYAQHGSLTVVTSHGEERGAYLIVCGGLQSDRLARLTGSNVSVQIVPFRGEYYRLVREAAHWVRGLIYPVPDPSFPFLGVHLSRDLQGEVECGPNAVLNGGRECYEKWQINLGDLAETLSYPGFLRLAQQHHRQAYHELLRSFSKLKFSQSVARLLPRIRPHHLLAHTAGIRAQAVTKDGQLVDDFLFEQGPHVLHVLNAPSPAATSSLAIGSSIADRYFASLDS